MTYRYRIDENICSRWKYKNGNTWECISDEVAQNLNIKVIDVFGDVGLLSDDVIGTLQCNDQVLDVFEMNATIPKKRRIYGYIPCTSEDGREGYLRIIDKRKKNLIIPFFIIMVSLIVGGIFLNNEFNDDGFFDKNAIAYQMPNNQINTNPNQIMIPVIPDVVVKKGTTNASSQLFNPKGNNCYFKYSIVLEQSSEVIYQSKWIKPGDGIMKFDISSVIIDDESPITIKVDTCALDNINQPLNGGEIESILRIVGE